MARKAVKRDPSSPDPFPRIFVEALAYHESGHAVMAALLGVPIIRIVIGPACDDPDFNGKVELGFPPSGDASPVYQSVLIRIASEPAEKLAPHHAQFAILHKTHRHLKPFNLGVRSDLMRALNTLGMSIYGVMGLTEATARQYFKRDYRDVAHRLFEVPVLQNAVRRLAGVLMERYELTDEQAREVILSEGPLSDDGLLTEWGFPPP